MTWVAISAVTIVFVGALTTWRRRTLTAKWAWNDVAIHVHIGMRFSEIFVTEVRSVSADAAHLVFETTRGELAIESRWVVPAAVSLLSAACGRTRGEVVRALNSARRVELWRGEAGGFRVPISP